MSATRARCPQCLRASTGCICCWVRPVAHEAGVLILQHPLETSHAKNSGRLLHLSLPLSRLMTGETFDVPQLLAALGSSAYPVLLYPAIPDDDEAPVLDEARLQNLANVQLVVLDATWRKSRKMLHLNPLLQSLPRLSLTGVIPSAYRIRKAHKPGQLSTLEATTAALSQLEGDAVRYRPLLDAFDGFVAQQEALLPVNEPAGKLRLRGR